MDSSPYFERAKERIVLKRREKLERFLLENLENHGFCTGQK
jgi:hypothetical protein